MEHAASSACTLPYPARFEAAQHFQTSEAAGEGLAKDETRLLLYALQQQAKQGPCKDPKPWAWNMIESAKWSSWKQLGNISSMEAMRLFVKVIEDEQPDWWALSQRAPAEAPGRPAVPAAAAAAAAAASQAAGTAAPLQNGHAVAPPVSLRDVGSPGEWVLVESSDMKRPTPRYEHAVATIGSSMYMVGGNCGGRFLNDVWRLNLDNLAWSLLLPHHPPTPPPQPANARNRRKVNFKDPEVAAENGEKQPLKPEPVLPPVAGHALLPWQGNLICIGGHTKVTNGAQSMVAYRLDIKTLQWEILQPSGLAPPARGGHTTDIIGKSAASASVVCWTSAISVHIPANLVKGTHLSHLRHEATLIGDRIFLFGGEDHQRHAQANLVILHLTDMAWEVVELDEDDGQPAARSAHTATSIQNRWVVVFGGGSAAHCFNDVWALDTQKLRWQPLNVAGTSPSPRAGHAAAALDEVWYVVGGGNNVEGCTDAIALDLQNLPDGDLVWVHVTNLARHGPLASEGLSMLALPSQKALLAWGGYNGQYHNHLHCFKPGTLQGTQTPAIPDTAMGAAKQLAEAVAAPVRAAAGLLSGTADAAASKPAAQADAQPAAAPAISRSSPFAQVALQQAPHQPQLSATAKQPAKAASSSDRGHLDQRVEGALGQVESARKEAATAKEAAGHELALMRRQLASAQSSHAAAVKEVDGLKAELAAEQAKRFEMEVEKSQMQRKLQQTDEMQKELESYRRMINDAQGKGKAGGGIWGYISGAS